MINAIILGMLLALSYRPVVVGPRLDVAYRQYFKSHIDRLDYIENSCWCAYTGPELSPDDVAWEDLK